jgi:tetratricopeptide (TPR) repeat protein
MRHRLLAGFARHRFVSLARELARFDRLLGSVLLVLSLACPAHAETVDMAVQSDEPAAYRDRIDEALREFAVQNYEEARSLFLQAHALLPTARTFRALGLCEYELRNYGESVKDLDSALASKVKPLAGALRADTERMVARARSFVGRVEVELRPGGATLMVDGVKVDGSEPLWLAMGEHTLEASAASFVSEKRKLSVKGGEDKKLSIILAHDESASADVDASTQKPSSAKRWYKSPWLWASLGVVVAGAGATTAVLLTRDSGTNHDGGSTKTTVPVP